MLVTALLTTILTHLRITAAATFRIGAARVLEAIFDPHAAWTFWLGTGLALGAFAHSRLRRLEETTRGRLGGPSMRYLRWEVRSLRVAIRWPRLRWLSADLDKDLHDLDRILVEVHGFPPLPSTHLADREGMARTDEYLRRILPHLTTSQMEEARRSAERLEKAGSRVPKNPTAPRGKPRGRQRH